VSPPASEAIEPEYVSLLQWLFTGCEAPVNPSFQKKAFFQFGQKEILMFARQLIPIYTPSINCLPLRYALLVFIGVITSGGLFTEREEDNACRARYALANRPLSAVEEGDAFAVFLLAFSSWVNPNASPKELGIHLKGFLSIISHVSRIRSTSRVQINALWEFRTVARDLLLHAAARDLTPECFNCFFNQSTETMGIPTLAQRAAYLGDDWVRHLYLNISYHEMVVIKGMRPFAFDSESYRPPWLAEMKNDIASMDRGMHFTLLPYVSMAITEIQPASTETIELALVTLLKYYNCSMYITIFETSSFPEGLATLAAKKVALDILHIASQVGEYNRRIGGLPEYKLQGSAWLCVRALALVAMTFPASSHDLCVCDSIISVSSELTFSRCTGS
jgi:hypothetical protein